VLDADLAGAVAAHRRLLAVLSSLTDDVARRPSRLPGWTVGHVVTHLARNADSFTGALTAAGRGELGLQYPGGPDQRVRDIDAGAGRDAAALVDDLARAATALERAWTTTTADVWRDGQASSAAGRIYPVADIPFTRWREVEIHQADLGLSPGPVWAEWSDEYLLAELDRSLPGVADRLPEGTSVRITVAEDGEVIHVPIPDPDARSRRLGRGELVAWITGRAVPDDLPPLTPW
jgi:maleylpyruvate isomerase